MELDPIESVRKILEKSCNDIRDPSPNSLSWYHLIFVPLQDANVNNLT